MIRGATNRALAVELAIGVVSGASAQTPTSPIRRALFFCFAHFPGRQPIPAVLKML